MSTTYTCATCALVTRTGDEGDGLEAELVPGPSRLSGGVGLQVVWLHLTCLMAVLPADNPLTMSRFGQDWRERYGEGPLPGERDGRCDLCRLAVSPTERIDVLLRRRVGRGLQHDGPMSETLVTHHACLTRCVRITTVEV